MIVQKVLIIHNIPSPYRLPIFERLSQKVDLEVFFLDGEMKGRFWANNLVNYNFKHKFSTKKMMLKNMMINLDLFKKITKENYDTVIIVDDPPTIFNTYLTLIAAKLTKKKIVIWNGRFQNGTFGSKNKLMEMVLRIHNKLIYKLFSDKIIAYGSRASELIKNEGVNPNKIVVGTQCYPKSLIHFNEDIDLSDKNKFVFLTISYLNSRKGIDNLIKAFKNAFGYSDQYLLHIIGDGSERERLEQLAKDCANIIFLGNLEKEVKYDYLKACDVFVLPTLYDSWGLVINEAMEFAKPIITTDMAMATHDIIKGNGIAIRAGSVEELEDAMIKITKEDYKEMGRKSLEIISKHDEEFVVNNFMTAIRG